jgi:hypothetical protein
MNLRPRLQVSIRAPGAPDDLHLRLSFPMSDSGYSAPLQLVCTFFSCPGLVPANGHVSIHVSFAPTRPMTYSVDVQVRVAQFNFVPFVSTIVGTGVTGETRYCRKLQTHVIGGACLVLLLLSQLARAGRSFGFCHLFQLMKDLVNDIVGAAHIVTCPSTSFRGANFCDEVISHLGSSLSAFAPRLQF